MPLNRRNLAVDERPNIKAGIMTDPYAQRGEVVEKYFLNLTQLILSEIKFVQKIL